MSQLPEAKLDILLARHAALEAELLGQVGAEQYVRMTRELAELNPVVEAVKAWRAIGTEIGDLDTLIADPATDADMRAMAEEERPTLEARSEELAQQLRVALLPKDAMDERNVVLEIRAGTGGDEASCSRAICSGCMNALRRCRAGRSRSFPPAKARSAATRKSSPRSRGAAHMPS